MQTRKPCVAGQFYPAQHDSCIEQISQCITDVDWNQPLPDSIAAGIVPHAGWFFSGHIAASVFNAIKQIHQKVNTFIIFGAAHSYADNLPVVYDKGSWLTPLGEVAIDEELADQIIKTETAVSNLRVHINEHSIEVQVPFIEYMFPGAKIVPIITAPRNSAIELGYAVGEIIKNEKDKKIICLGSTDLTHYGPRYGFDPVGGGPEALKWAFEVNDVKFINLALSLEPQQLLVEAAENCNACGSGAAAAVVAAAKKLEKSRGILLAHENSNDIMIKKMNRASSEAVGYAAIIF
jgi:hypothetical protein